MTIAALRREFELQLISPYGCHLKPEICCCVWERRSWEDVPAQIAAATEWLSHVNRTKNINHHSTSYRYKHEAERWSYANGGVDYIINGSLIMAAKRMGFRIEPIVMGLRCTPDLHPSGFITDCQIAYLNIGAERPGR